MLLHTEYVHLMHQSIKVDQRKPTAQMNFVMSWENKPGGSPKKRKFWIRICQLTLCSSCKLSSITFQASCQQRTFSLCLSIEVMGAKRDSGCFHIISHKNDFIEFL